jgi:hypothetical protein
MNATTNDPYRTTYHRDGTATLWNVYEQRWIRVEAGKVSDRVLSSLSHAERARLAAMAARSSR